MKLFKNNKQKAIDGLDLPFKAHIIDIKNFKKGWKLAIAEDNSYILIKDNRVVTNFTSYQSFKIAKNNRAQVTLTDGRKLILSADGYCIGGFDTQNELFDNGWFVLKRCDTLTLYNSIGMLVGENLKKAKVFPNGYYHMSVTTQGEAKYAGVFDNHGNKLLLTNTENVEMYPSGWFIASGMLYDNLGNCFLGMKGGYLPPIWKVKLFARIMPKRKREKLQSTKK